ncbi:uncharacterized protein LOC141698232 isoform X2 [Apium graveolens]|uniref:uncharacterized protein LOC141698232 isoform X2 n=1 Tax=Apium graveolens TaxID=4045 RepID=UPI003D7BF42B
MVYHRNSLPHWLPCNLIQGYRGPDRSRPRVVKSYYWKDFTKSNEWTEKIILLVKTIDLEAAADLRVGINYVSKEFLLDASSLERYHWSLGRET